jgi:hypothetical protein
LILALLLAAASPQSAIDAEHEFAARAQTEGMWTAFRATASPGASMFVPQHVRAHDFLKDRKDPLIGYMWWPAEAFVSCDGSVAVTTGPSVLGRTRGYFTTLWAQHEGGWKWLFDHGDALERPRPAGETARVRTASCKRLPPVPAGWSETLLEEADSAGIGSNGVVGKGRSADGSLTWEWKVTSDGGRTVEVFLWDGAKPVQVLKDRVEAPKR